MVRGLVTFMKWQGGNRGIRNDESVSHAQEGPRRSKFPCHRSIVWGNHGRTLEDSGGRVALPKFNANQTQNGASLLRLDFQTRRHERMEVLRAKTSSNIDR